MSNRLTIQQVADELGVSTKTLRRWEESGYLVPDEREQGTNIRLYHPYRIEYWKKLLELNRSLKNHLRLLDGLRKELDKHMMEQDYVPGQPLKLFTDSDIENFSRAYDAMEKWEKEYKIMLQAILDYPKSMLQATIEDDEEEKK